MTSRQRPFRGALMVAVALLVVGSVGCSERTPLPDPRDLPEPPPKVYPRTEAGIIASLIDHISSVGPDLGEWAPPKDQAKCVAERVVRRLGAAHLLEIGFDPQKGSLALSYPPEERTAVVNLLVGCIDFAQGYLELLSSYQKISLAAASCMSRGFERLGVPRDLAAGLVDGKEPDPFADNDRVSTSLATLLDECLSKLDMIPGAPLPPLPVPSTSSSTTSTPNSNSTTRPPASTTSGR